jgi:hypothetical protein
MNESSNQFGDVRSRRNERVVPRSRKRPAWMLWQIAFLLLLMLANSSQAVVPPSKSFLSRPVLVPIEVIRSGHIAIRAKINGYGPYRFIFDTGAPTLLVSEQVAREAHILPRDFQRPFFTPLGNLGEFKIRSIVLGRANQPNLLSDVWNHPTVEELSRAFGRFEGLIGYPFFAHYQVTIDYKSKTMMLVPSPYQPTDTKEKMTQRLTQGGEAKVFAPGESIGIQITKSATDTAAGVQVTTVMPQGPADDAGMKAGDRLLTLDGRWTDSIEDTFTALVDVETDRAVPATVLRDGKEITVQIKVKPAI